jgi:hypothetical protein
MKQITIKGENIINIPNFISLYRGCILGNNCLHRKNNYPV